jgi:ribose/xylose/arabinose/galactoside ABC-type transport system permease subunit
MATRLRGIARVVLTSFVTSLAAWLGALAAHGVLFSHLQPRNPTGQSYRCPYEQSRAGVQPRQPLVRRWLPWVTELFNHCAWFWMLAMVKISRWATEIPGAYSFVAAPSAFTFIIYYGFLIGFMSGWLWKPERRPRTVAALALIALFYGGQWFFTRRNMELTILPLDGGQAEYFDAAGRVE